VLVIVPCDPLRPRRVDPHFAPEATAARHAGLDVVVIDHDALVRAEAERAIARVDATGLAVYRGWMLSSVQYAAFAEALARRGVTLRTSPTHYRRAHELPGWYPQVAELTAESVWTTGTGRDLFDSCRARLGSGPAVLRDYTKSLKHHWDEAVFIPDVADGEAAWRVAHRFLQLRGEDLAGGLVLRRYEKFTSAEVRTWWVAGHCVLVSAHPDTPDHLPPPDLDLAPFSSAVAALNLPFVTVDLVQRADGVWRIVEVGDGQVSDRPSSTDPASFIAALFNR